MAQASATIIAATVCFALLGCEKTVADSPANGWQVGVLENAANALENGYVFEDVGADLAAMLRASDSKFANIDDKNAYAEAVTHAMQSIANDKHLRLFYSPAESDLGGEGQMDHSSSPCHQASIEWEILEGDIGYIRFALFMDQNGFLDRFDDAMRALASAKAMIIDLRLNCGGEPEPVQHIATYFFNERTQLLSAQIRGQGVFENWTKHEVAGPRMATAPLYILISGNTFSAAESFAFAMQINERATLVGENSGGGGHFGDTRRLSPDFTLFVPFGRAFDPRTGATWEATGVTPDIEVSAEIALKKALELAKAATE